MRRTMRRPASRSAGCGVSPRRCRRSSGPCSSIQIRERAEPSRRSPAGDRTIARGPRPVPRGCGAGSARRASALQLRAGPGRCGRRRGCHPRARPGAGGRAGLRGGASVARVRVVFRRAHRRRAAPPRRAAGQLPDSAAAHSDYGGALAAAGRLAAAEAELRRAVEIDPTYAPARANLERVLQLRDVGKAPRIKLASGPQIYGSRVSAAGD